MTSRLDAEDRAGGGEAALLRHNVRLDRIEHIPIDQLRFPERRLRKRSDAGLDKLKSSVRAFGLVAPILVDRQNVIIAGAGIVEAAQACGYSEVPTVRVDHLDEGEVRLLRIALNRLAETSEWDRIELAAEFSELAVLDLDLELEVTGFGAIEIDNLMHADDAAEEADDQPEPVAQVAVSQVGDLWELGEHRVVCGSSLEPEVLARLMAGQQARMVLTDHPFNVKIGGHVSGLGKNRHREFAQASGEMSEVEFIAFRHQPIVDRTAEFGAQSCRAIEPERTTAKRYEVPISGWPFLPITVVSSSTFPLADRRRGADEKRGSRESHLQSLNPFGSRAVGT